MAMNVVIPLLIPLEENIRNTTRLLSSLPVSDVQFHENRYCAVIFEDDPPSTLVTKIKASHKNGLPMRYSIVEGNQDGLFTIDKKTGEISLAAFLDRETQARHELVVAADAGSNPSQSLVQVTVADVNDNAPEILNQNPQFAVIEEDDRDLPLVLGKIEAQDKDWIDGEELLYTLSGEGIDDQEPDDAYFSIDSRTGEIFQLRPLDRDPPKGRPIWKLKVKVHDGQTEWADMKSLHKTFDFYLPRSKKQKRSTRNLRSDLRSIRGKKLSKNLAESFYFKNKLEPRANNSSSRYFNLTVDKDFHPRVKRNSKNNTDFNNYYKSAKFFQNKLRDAKLVYSDSSSGNVYNYNNFLNNFKNDKTNLNLKNGNQKEFLSPKENRPKRNKRTMKVQIKTQKVSKKFINPSKSYSLDRTLRRRRNSRVTRDTTVINSFASAEDANITKAQTTIRPILDGGNCVRLDSLLSNLESVYEAQLNYVASKKAKGRPRGQIHVTETVVTVIAKDVNDNAPTFLNKTIYEEVQENGPIDLLVAVVKAYDADDNSSGTNALLTYSIEKNVVDEETGNPLFTIHPHDGVLKTAVCCLDRETTPEYQLQVVASDGGGLKGTGTVIVRLSDLNDNSPRLSRREWTVSLDESDGNTDDQSTLFELTVQDPDTSNYFLYRIVPGSGNGWQKFGIRTKGRIGEVYSLDPLDYEDEKQRRGLRFLVEVTDRGPGGWDDRRHVDSAWVSVTLSDVNDNSPTFRKYHSNVNISEDVPVGTLLETLAADDPDEGANGLIEYRLLDSWDNLQVNAKGEIRVHSPMDRESHPGTNGTAVRVIAVDHGEPPRTSTATLTVHLQDVNDCPPRLLPPTILHVEENLPPKMIGTLVATDDDVWSLGHGPPFQLKLSDLNSEFVKKRVRLRFRQDLDDGHGGAEVWTRIPLDREESRQMIVKITLFDAAGLSATSKVIIVVDDVNDNPMKPGSKTVFLWKTQGTSSEAPLGRVYVNDLDDWDIKDKNFKWADAPHPLFTLQESTGEIFASGQVREGRYDLKFNVSDSLWGQKNIAAKVTVVVRLLSPDAVSHAVPLTLAPTTAAELTQDWIPSKGGGGLGLLTSAVESTLEGKVSEVKVVSVYEPTFPQVKSLVANDFRKHRRNKLRKKVTAIDGSKFFSSTLGGAKHEVPENPHLGLAGDFSNREVTSEVSYETVTGSNSACVWLSAKDESGSYIDIVKLRGLLELNLKQIQNKSNFTIQIGTTEEFLAIQNSFPSFSSSSSSVTSSPHSSSSSFNASSSSYSWSATADPSAAASLASKILPLQVVDSNATSLVTPRLSLTKKCSQISPLSESPSGFSCNHFQCLNGGKCIPTERSSRCICPGHTKGPYCYLPSRSFSTNSWLWLDPLPQCFPLEVSFRFLTRYPDGMLLYSGSLSSTKNVFNAEGSQENGDHSHPPLLIIQLSNGRPQLILEGLSEPQRLEIKAFRSLNDGEWHLIHLFINNKGIKFMLDGCSTRHEDEEKVTFSNCLVYSPWANEKRLETMWGSTSPLQLGGIANEPPILQNEDTSFQIISQSLKGCISDLRISGKLVDLGEPKYSYNSHPGCYLQDIACNVLQDRCEGNAMCQGGLSTGTFCSCALGWSGSSCEQPTRPISLGPSGFIKVALSFTPDPLRLDFSLRIRTRLKNGIIFKLTSQHNFASLNLRVHDSVPCLIYSSRSESSKEPSSAVSIVGITSTSSVKALNSSNTFYIKNWNQYEFDDRTDKLKTKHKPSKNTVEDKLIASTSSVCASGHSISDGDWYHITGSRFGYNLVLELNSENVFHRNETLGVFDVYESKLLSVKKKIKEPPDKFIVDVREGLVIGNVPEVPETKKQEETFKDPETCLEDFRISGKSLPLPPAVNGSRWGQVAATDSVRVGCSSSAKCGLSTCPDDLVCAETWSDTSCRCPPHHTLSQHGCRAFDVCLFGPCLNGGVCHRSEHTFDCLCPSQFNGQFCQWRISNGKTGGYFTPIVLGSLTALFVIAVIFLILFCHRFRRKRQRKRREKGEDKKEEGLSCDNEYVTLELKKEDKLQKKKEESLLRKEKEISIEREIKMEIEEIEKTIEKETERRKKAIQGIPQLEEHRSKAVGEPLAVLLPRDDLRAYAYEGEGGSSEGSLGSAISDLRREINVETEESVTLSGDLGEVVDLLRNLPDASLHYRQPESQNLATERVSATNSKTQYCLEGDTLSVLSNLDKRKDSKSESKGISKRFTISSSNEDLCEDDSGSSTHGDAKRIYKKKGSVGEKPSSSFWYAHPGTKFPQSNVSVISSYSPSSGRTDSIISSYSPSSGRAMEVPGKKSKSKSSSSSSSKPAGKNKSSKKSVSKSSSGSKRSSSRSPKSNVAEKSKGAHHSGSSSKDDGSDGVGTHISLHV